MTCPFCNASARPGFDAEDTEGAAWFKCGTLLSAPEHHPRDGQSFLCTDAEISALKNRISQLEEFVISVATNFDCDEDSHKYHTQCRACDAQKLIEIRESEL